MLSVSGWFCLTVLYCILLLVLKRATICLKAQGCERDNVLLGLAIC